MNYNNIRLENYSEELDEMNNDIFKGEIRNIDLEIKHQLEKSLDAYTDGEYKLIMNKVKELQVRRDELKSKIK